MPPTFFRVNYYEQRPATCQCRDAFAEAEGRIPLEGRSDAGILNPERAAVAVYSEGRAVAPVDVIVPPRKLHRRALALVNTPAHGGSDRAFGKIPHLVAVKEDTDVVPLPEGRNSPVALRTVHQHNRFEISYIVSAISMYLHILYTIHCNISIDLIYLCIHHP